MTIRVGPKLYSKIVLYITYTHNIYSWLYVHQVCNTFRCASATPAAVLLEVAWPLALGSSVAFCFRRCSSSPSRSAWTTGVHSKQVTNKQTTTAYIIFRDEYLVTFELFVIIVLRFMTFYTKHYYLVAKMRCSSLSQNRNRHKLIYTTILWRLHFCYKG
jgi:hypothetical protein